MINLEPPATIMAFLAEIGATNIPHHAGRSLYAHLIATWEILIDWQQPEAVVIGGLCHSVYGTDAFDTACLGPNDRGKVRAAIGPRAEQISYLFGAMQRELFLVDPGTNQIEDRFSGKLRLITNEERSALCHILLANELDLAIAKKGTERHDKINKKVGPVFKRISPFLSASAISYYQDLSGKS